MRAWLRDVADPIPAVRRERSLVTGAILLALTAFAVYCSITRHVPFLGGQAGEVVRAEFAQANFIDDQTPVRVGGVNVGTVTSVRIDRSRNRALVTMRVSNPLVVKRDALAAIRWRTMLGGTFYIDLDPGSPSAPLLGDRVIPAAQTSTQVEFDDLNQVLHGHTQLAPRIFAREMRQAFGDPHAVGRALTALSARTPTIARGGAALRGQRPDDLRRLVAGTSATVAALGRDTAALRGVVTGMEGTFAVTASERQALGRLIDLSPRALDSTYATMRRVRTTLGYLDPLVTALRPGARLLAPTTGAATPTFVALRRLLGDARPLLRSLRPALRSLQRAARDGAPLMVGLTPTLDRLRTDIDPWLARRDPTTGMRTYEAIGPTFAAANSAASELDGEGYWLHFPTQSDSRSIVVGLPGGAGVAPLARICAAPRVSARRCASLQATLGRLFGGLRR
jgi:virulence factor Mce-like protein